MKSDENGCETSVGFREGDRGVHENKCHVVLEDTSLNQDGYSNNDDCQVMTTISHKNCETRIPCLFIQCCLQFACSCLT